MKMISDLCATHYFSCATHFFFSEKRRSQACLLLFEFCATKLGKKIAAVSTLYIRDVRSSMQLTSMSLQIGTMAAVRSMVRVVFLG